MPRFGFAFPYGPDSRAAYDLYSDGEPKAPEFVVIRRHFPPAWDDLYPVPQTPENQTMLAIPVNEWPSFVTWMAAVYKTLEIDPAIMASMLPDSDGDPRGWIQFKGTDICMDLHCKCGAMTHVDGEFAYSVRCPDCGQVYECDPNITLKPISAPDERGVLDGFR